MLSLLLLFALAAPVEASAAPYTPKLLTPGLTCKAFDRSGQEIERSTARKCRFLRMVAANHPEWAASRLAKFRACDADGDYVNHITPLACGGCDVPSNMELMSRAEWAGRTGPERTDCGRHPGGEW